MNGYVYILFCDQKIYYVGSTNNIKRRLFEHQNKLSNFTQKFSDIKLVYQEVRTSREEAWQREKQLKGWSTAKKKALINGKIGQLRELSKKH